jgi:CheY-like chemotaxis protein
VKKSILVDQYMRTSDENIFACGDCCEKFSFFTKKPSHLRLASIATTESRIAGANLFELKRKSKGPIGVFSTVVGDLALGAAGLTEQAANEMGLDVISATAVAPDRHPGGMPGCSELFIKLLFLRDSGVIVGGQAIGGSSTGELLNALSAAIQSGMTADDLATFQIGTHPALTASPIAYQLVNAAEGALSQVKRKRVLIVEDDDDFAEATKSILSQKPYAVERVENGTEAMASIEREKPDLILLDIMMDSVDEGLVVARKLKSNPEYWDIPILALSAIGKTVGFLPEIGNEFMADAFIEKPVRSGELMGKVEELLAK